MSAYDYCAHYAFIGAILQKDQDAISTIISDSMFPMKNPFNWTPLHYVIAFSDFEMTKKILEVNGSYLNTQDRYRRTPLSIAALRGNPDIVKLLLLNGAEVNIGLPLCYAAKNGNSECVLALIEGGCDIDELDAVNSDLKITLKYTPLIIAIQQSHPEIVRLLVEHGVNTNFDLNEHLTPLHYACQDGTLEMVKILLAKDTELNSRCQHDNVPLEYALLNEKFDVIQCLLEAGASVNIVGKMGQSPLHSAVSCREANYVEEILKYNPDLNIRDIENGTPLHLCSYNWKIDEAIFEALVNGGAELDVRCDRSWTPLHFCSVVGNLKCVKLLLDKLPKDGVNAVTMDNITPLYLAACKGHTDICKELLAKGAFVNIQINKFKDLCSFHPFDLAEDDVKVGYTAEKIATEKEKHDIVELINYYKENHPDRNIEHVEVINLTRAGILNEITCEGFDIKAKDMLGWTCLHYAAEKGDYNLTKFCINKIKDVDVGDKFGRTPLTLAAANGHLDVVKLLTENGAKANIGNVAFYAIEDDQIECLKYFLDNSNLDALDRKKRTPVMYAALKNNLPVLQEFLSRSVDVTQRDEDGETALHLACNNNSRDVVELLIKNNADVNAQSCCCSETPLFNAAVRKNLDTFEVLLQHGANPNLADHFRQTPLHYLSEYGTIEYVKKLLACAADISVEDSDSYTPFLLSLCNEDESVLKALLEHGADIRNTLYGGWTALHICAYYEELKVAEELIRLDIDVNALSQEGISPLYIAAARGHKNFVKMLIQKGAYLDAPVMALTDWRELPHFARRLPRLEGGTPLVAAVCNGHLEIVKILCSAGSSLSVTTEGNMTPLCLSVTNSNYPMFEYLAEQMGELSAPEKEKVRLLAGKKFRQKIKATLYMMDS